MVALALLLRFLDVVKSVMESWWLIIQMWWQQEGRFNDEF
jgi:hypothetical protein